MLEGARTHSWGLLAYDTFTKFIECFEFNEKYFIHDFSQTNIWKEQT
jgi:hypothetical protein